MPLSSPQLRRFVRRALIDATGAARPDRPALIAAFTKLCDCLHQRLQTLFGTAAVIALFARAFHVAAVEFPWLANVVPPNGAGCSLANPAALHEIEMGLVEEGLAAVLALNVGLLTALVGEDLILPLVQEAWGAAMIDDDQPDRKVINE